MRSNKNAFWIIVCLWIVGFGGFGSVTLIGGILP
jgi:hypothetical protein